MTEDFNLTDETRELYQYLLDLNGYLVVENVLSESQLAYINKVLDETLESVPADEAEAEAFRKERAARAYRFGAAGGSHETNPGFLQYDQIFVDLYGSPIDDGNHADVAWRLLPLGSDFWDAHERRVSQRQASFRLRCV